MFPFHLKDVYMHIICVLCMNCGYFNFFERARTDENFLHLFFTTIVPVPAFVLYRYMEEVQVKGPGIKVYEFLCMNAFQFR